MAVVVFVVVVVADVVVVNNKNVRFARNRQQISNLDNNQHDRFSKQHKKERTEGIDKCDDGER